MDNICGFENLKKFILDYTRYDGTKFDLEGFINKTINSTNTILVVDRIEDGYAVCEDRNTKEIIDIRLDNLRNRY